MQTYKQYHHTLWYNHLWIQGYIIEVNGFFSLKLCSPVIKKEDTNSRSLKKKNQQKINETEIAQNMKNSVKGIPH